MEPQRRRDTEDSQRMQEVPPWLNQLSEQVIGAAIEVHKELGPGYLESVYEETLAFELYRSRVPFLRQFRFSTLYKGHPVGEGRVDLLIRDIFGVELKAVDELTAIHRAQVISYLRALDKPLGLLINFNVPLLKDGLRRIILSA
jgi:GxxExxY protein